MTKHYVVSTFEVDDLVMLLSHHLSSATAHFSASLAHKWAGPFRIMRKCSNVNFVLEAEDVSYVGIYQDCQLKRFCPHESHRILFRISIPITLRYHSISITFHLLNNPTVITC